MVYPRIHDPVLYEWDNHNNSATHDRYDYPKAWPSSGQLHVEFSILAAISAVTALFCCLLIVSLLRSKRVRSAVFNWYLLFIAIPDCMVSFLCMLTCALSAPQSHFYSEGMCGFQSFYLNWAFISNAWLNGVVVFQIHRMLRHSKIRRKYIPPSRKQVCMHAAAVYGYATFWGFLCGFNLDFLPHSSHLYYGFACMPMEYNRASTLFFWLVYIPFSLGIPLVFATYVLVDILRNKLLPPSGKRRALSMFLLRLCFIYFSIWLPFLFLFLLGNFIVINPLIHWIGAAISHLQGLISALFCLTNKDIRRSFVMLVTCQPFPLDDRLDASDRFASQDGIEGRSDHTRRSMSRMLSRVFGSSDRTLSLQRGAFSWTNKSGSRLSLDLQENNQQECPSDTQDEKGNEEQEGDQQGKLVHDDKGNEHLHFLAEQRTKDAMNLSELLEDDEVTRSIKESGVEHNGDNCWKYERNESCDAGPVPLNESVQHVQRDPIYANNDVAKGVTRWLANGQQSTVSPPSSHSL